MNKYEMAVLAEIRRLAEKNAALLIEVEEMKARYVELGEMILAENKVGEVTNG